MVITEILSLVAQAEQVAEYLLQHGNIARLLKILISQLNIVSKLFKYLFL